MFYFPPSDVGSCFLLHKYAHNGCEDHTFDIGNRQISVGLTLIENDDQSAVILRCLQTVHRSDVLFYLAHKTSHVSTVCIGVR